MGGEGELDTTADVFEDAYIDENDGVTAEWTTATIEEDWTVAEIENELEGKPSVPLWVWPMLTISVSDPCQYCTQAWVRNGRKRSNPKP